MRKPLARGLKWPCWPDSVSCPSCRSVEPYKIKKVGIYLCRIKACRRDFRVMTGSVMERSHAELTQWEMGFWLAASSKKGFCAHQLHRALVASTTPLVHASPHHGSDAPGWL